MIKSSLREIFKLIVNITARAFRILPGSKVILDQLVRDMVNSQEKIIHKKFELSFSAPNWLNRYRIKTFSNKEPDTLKWIEDMSDGSIFWDIGANVGLYSIYAAKNNSCQVYAFEPSVFNLEFLARNISLNDLQELVTIVPLPLSNKTGNNFFEMSNTEWGGALSTFGENIDQNGKPMEAIFKYMVFGITADEAADKLGLPKPRYMKIDVDGIEHLILRGGKKILAEVDSVMVEINDRYPEQAEESSRYLIEAGLSLYKKCDLGVPFQYNQWWVR